MGIYKVNRIKQMLEEMETKIKEFEDRRLVKVCEEVNFYVNNFTIKEELQGLLPENANIIVNSYLDMDLIIIVAKCMSKPIDYAPPGFKVSMNPIRGELLDYGVKAARGIFIH